MRAILFFLLFTLPMVTIAQPGECLFAYVSDFYIINETEDNIQIKLIPKLNNSFYETESSVIIAPGDSTHVATFQWALEFRNPPLHYEFRTAAPIDRDPNLPEHWEMIQKSDTEAHFRFVCRERIAPNPNEELEK